MATGAGRPGPIPQLNPAISSRAGWQDFSPLYPGEQECLASFLALECAEVLAGAKPANLISLANKNRSCGRNLYQLWKRHGDRVLAGSRLQARLLADRGTSALLIFFDPDNLSGMLQRKDVKAVLGKAGYGAPSDLEGSLETLKSRMKGSDFPHEIGVFLGYPLKDVMGFMGWGRQSFTCQGPWKVFGDPTESLRLVEKHRVCRCLMSSRLASGCNPLECLQALGPAGSFGNAADFLPVN